MTSEGLEYVPGDQFKISFHIIACFEWWFIQGVFLEEDRQNT